MVIIQQLISKDSKSCNVILTNSYPLMNGMQLTRANKHWKRERMHGRVPWWDGSTYLTSYRRKIYGLVWGSNPGH